SVLAMMNSTPSTLLLTMCATALPPPPPTPMTLITALGAIFSISSKHAMSVVLFWSRDWLMVIRHSSFVIRDSTKHHHLSGVLFFVLSARLVRFPADPPGALLPVARLPSLPLPSALSVLLPTHPAVIPSGTGDPRFYESRITNHQSRIPA